MRTFDREQNDQRLLKKANSYSASLQQPLSVSMPSDTASTAVAAASTVAVSASTVSIAGVDAGATYTPAAQTLINELKSALSTLVTDHNTLVTAFGTLKTDHNTLVTAFGTLTIDHNDLVTRYNTLLVNLRSAGLMA